MGDEGLNKKAECSWWLQCLIRSDLGGGTGGVFAVSISVYEAGGFKRVHCDIVTSQEKWECIIYVLGKMVSISACFVGICPKGA